MLLEKRKDTLKLFVLLASPLLHYPRGYFKPALSSKSDLNTTLLPTDDHFLLHARHRRHHQNAPLICHQNDTRFFASRPT